MPKKAHKGPSFICVLATQEGVIGTQKTEIGHGALQINHRRASAIFLERPSTLFILVCLLSGGASPIFDLTPIYQNRAPNASGTRNSRTIMVVTARSVAVIGAGPSGAIATEALVKEQAFDRIRVFERKAVIGGAWYVEHLVNEGTWSV